MIFFRSRMMKKQRTFTVLTTVLFSAALLLIFSPYASPAGCAPPPQVRMVPQSFTQLAKNCGPAVVNISTVKTLTSGGGQVFEHFFRGPQGQQDPFGRFFEDFFKNQPAGNSSRAVLEAVLSWIKMVISSPITM
ncbi:MAG: hypothetical protein R2875_18660 [Desulfobacterales bacterium]